MMKSHSDSLLIVAGGILKDVSLAYPEYRSVGKDLNRLTSLVKERGLGVFTLDLPSREQALLEGLDSGRLDPSGTLRYSKNYPVPRLYAGLYMRIFDKNLCLRTDVDVNAVAFLRQLLTLGKKTEVPCTKKRELLTVEEYIHVENQLPSPTFNWGADELDLGGVNDFVNLCDPLVTNLPLFPELNAEDNGVTKILLQRCQRVADFVAEELGTFCPDCFIEARREGGRRLGLRHGPGAVAERTGVFDKYQFTNWPVKLSSIFPYDLYGRMPNSPNVVGGNEVPSRLISVPKTAKGPRLIAAEPSEHQWCQQLIREWLDERIRHSSLGWFINFQDQSLSGKLALEASRTGELATVDLSSASDRLTLWVVERIFRRNPSLLKALHAVRTRWIHIKHKDEYLVLKKYASQGTATTFPVQTLVFLVLALACALDGPPTRDRLRRMRDRVRVFGDDIILPKTGYADLVVVLSRLHLKVNVTKSFSNGYFRESCGTDGFMGYDVTPVKPKTTISDGPASCMAVLDTSNNLFYKGYWNASDCLKYRLDSDRKQRFIIVGRGAGATGYQSFSLHSACERDLTISSTQQWVDFMGQPSDLQDQPRKAYSSHWKSRGMAIRYDSFFKANPGFKVRWNRKLCRMEVRCGTIRSKSTIRPYDCGYSGLLEGQIKPPAADRVSSRSAAGVPERSTTKVVDKWVDLSTVM